MRAVIAAARKRDLPADVHLAPSTVHRLLAREGLLDKSPEAPTADRRRFAYRYAGELWMSDVMHGPAVADGRKRRKSYLIAFIDDATRVVPFAAFAFAENTAAFLPVFKQALLRRGQPARLYVDNGSAYRSRQLALVCAKLGVALIHARPYQPAGKGKIERYFRTLRGSWLAHLDLAAIDGIDALNHRLWAWVEGEYHQSPHRGLDGETPLDRWAATGADVRYPNPGPDFDDLFLFEVKRRVMKDRTVSLNGRLYEVDALLVGRTVVLRYDPAAPPNRPLQVVHDGKPAGQATVLDAYANTAVRRLRPSWQIHTDDAAPGTVPVPHRPAQPQGQRLMYTRHFAFTRLPFENDLHTDELFQSSAHREAQVRLKHLVELRGIGLLTGEVGSGKTTVCRHVTAGLHPGLHRVYYVSLTTGNVLDMYKSIAWELGLPTERSRATAYRAIRNEISRLVTEAKQLPVLIVDEAQHLRNDVLEDLRLLTNFNMDAERRLCMLLVGLTELRRRLAMAVHESLSQRLVVRHHIGSLERNELDDYLSHRLRLAGCELPLFEPPAAEALFQGSRGLPRQINRIAHYALSAAALAKARTVDAEHMQQALDELRL